MASKCRCRRRPGGAGGGDVATQGVGAATVRGVLTRRERAPQWEPIDSHRGRQRRRAPPRQRLEDALDPYERCFSSRLLTQTLTSRPELRTGRRPPGQHRWRPRRRRHLRRRCLCFSPAMVAAARAESPGMAAKVAAATATAAPTTAGDWLRRRFAPCARLPRSCCHPWRRCTRRTAHVGLRAQLREAKVALDDLHRIRLT